MLGLVIEFVQNFGWLKLLLRTGLFGAVRVNELR